MADRLQFRKTMASELGAPSAGVATGLLHKGEDEMVTFHQLDSRAEVTREVTREAQGGLEMLVIEGAVVVAGDHLSKHDWLRLPEGADFKAVAESDGAKLWIKSGQLPYARPPSR